MVGTIWICSLFIRKDRSARLCTPQSKAFTRRTTDCSLAADNLTHSSPSTLLVLPVFWLAFCDCWWALWVLACYLPCLIAGTTLEKISTSSCSSIGMLGQFFPVASFSWCAVVCIHVYQFRELGLMEQILVHHFICLSEIITGQGRDLSWQVYVRSYDRAYDWRHPMGAGPGVRRF